MSEIKKAVSLLGDMAGVDSKEVISLVTTWNKDKVYPMSVIDIRVTSTGVTDNSEKVGELVDTIEAYVEDMVKNALDADSVAEAKKTVAEMGKFLVETRKIQTNPLKEVAGRFTKHESRFDTFAKKLSAKIDAINEKAYEVSEKAIRAYFDEYLKEKELIGIVSMEAFADFIANKRKTAIFTSTNKLNKAIKDAIEKAVSDVATPILEAKALEEKKAQQSRTFEHYLDGISIDGSNELLSASLITLEKLKASVPELYPDVVESCYRSIDNKIGRINSNMTANKALAEKEAIKNADGELLARYEDIKAKSQNMTLSLEELRVLKDELLSLYNRFTFVENKERAKALGVSIANRILDAEAKETIIPSIVDAPEVSPTDIVPEKNSYYLDIEDLEVLAGIAVVAESEEEAKAELVRRFATHLDMIELIKGVK